MPEKKKRRRTKYTRSIVILAACCLFLLNILLLLPERSSSGAVAAAPIQETALVPEAEAVDPHEVPASTLPDDTNTRYRKEVSAPEPEVLSPLPGTEKLVYLVLDDAGSSLAQVEPFLDIPVPLTIAVLPFLQESGEVSKAVHEAGHTVFLHLPLEPLGDNDPGPNAILVSHREKEIQGRLHENLGALTAVKGVNNHMGSLATADERVMRIILGELKRRNLFFLDSRTTADTVVPRVAGELSLSFGSRHIFLDHDPEPQAIRQALREAQAVADAQGHVIAIGHVTVPYLADILRDACVELKTEGYIFRSLEDSNL